MRTNVEVNGADARSSRSEEERGFNDPSSPMRNSQDGSQRFRKEEQSRIQYTDEQQAELFRKLDSIKGHVLRGADQPPMGHVPSSYYNPFPFGMYPSTTSHVPAFIDPYGFPIHGRPHNWYPNQMMLARPPGQYVDIGPDILDPHLQDPRFFPATPTRYGDVPYNSPVLPHADNVGQYSPHHDAQAQAHHTRWPSESDPEMGGAFARGHAVSDTDSRRCHPLAGGAPFIACHNCFELLYLPKKKQQKLHCGACSELFSFTVIDKKLVFSSSAPVDVETTNRVPLVVPLKNEEPRIHQEAKTDPDQDTKVPPPLPENSNLLELFEYSNVNRAALTYGMAQLGYNKQKSYAKQDSLKPESVATETDNEYYNNTETSEDSSISKTSKERNRKEGSDYSFSEMPNKIITEEQEMEQYEVWVNGHLIPEDLVISAEKQAGPVQAGKYWYDYRAGFWGVMGNPCLGIIPPFIEEFSRPMPDNCGAGNTGVFVNGRELHERDLELLAGRGLPRGKNRSYIVDISGRVLDGDSGEELKGLGKLAPTIEKVKHGFGMRVPKSLASSA